MTWATHSGWYKSCCEYYGKRLFEIEKVTKKGKGIRMVEWHIYMVRCADGSLYTGIAKDIESRISKHNAGRGAKYTRARRPVELVYQETAQDHGVALRREYAIKQFRPAEKQLLIAKFTESNSTQEKISLAGIKVGKK